MPINLSLYLIVEGLDANPEQYMPVIRDALDNGVTAVQLRQKQCSMREKYLMAQHLRKLTLEFKVPLIINDHVDIAMAVDADGVHVGQQDLPCESVRSLLGKHKMIGCSVSSTQECMNTDMDTLDYIGVGPIYKTNTKHDAASVIGIKGLMQIKALGCQKPMVAIGGITAMNMIDVRAQGVGVAVSSAICLAKNPAKASQLLC